MKCINMQHYPQLGVASYKQLNVEDSLIFGSRETVFK
jgi:hypothetical protein